MGRTGRVGLSWQTCFPLVGQEEPLSYLGVLPSAAALASVALLTTTTSLTGAHLSQGTSTMATTQPVVSPMVQPNPIAGAQARVPTGTPSTALGLSLSPAMEPIPPKLVDRIRAGEFVEMRDLMSDNIALIQQLETFNTSHCALPNLPGILRPRLREVSSITSWLFCFMAYMAVRTTDQATRDMLAYARILLREAQRQGGQGWLDYDRVFRQQAAISPTLPWNTLHPGLQAATLLGRASGTSMFCTLCREADHTADHCALAYLQKPPDTNPPAPLTRYTNAGPRVRLPPRPRPESLARICISWNKGQCLYPACNYQHICATCQQNHKARDCASTPDGSEYKRMAGRRTPTTQAGHLTPAAPPRPRR